MKYISVTIMTFIFTTSLIMASGGSPSFEELNKTPRQAKPVVEVIDQSSKKTERKLCLTTIAKNKVKEKPC